MFKKIVCPLDFSDNSLKALKTAAELANLCQSGLVLLHVEESFMSEEEMMMLRVSPEHYQEVQKQKALEAKRQMSEAAEGLELKDVDVEFVLREGSPRRDIPDTAREIGADLIVLSSTGRDTLMEKIIGSTAEAVVRQSKIPVMIVYS